jgi:carboxymethylenebutenolidase
MTDVSAEWVRIAQPNLDLDAYLAQPQADGRYPAVVVLQEVFGVNSHIRTVTERLAQAGFVAIAPALFQRTAPGLDLGYSEVDLALGRQHKDQTTFPQLLGDIQACIDYLATLPSVRPTGVGVIGFCFGGHVAYLAATLPVVKATAVFYGAGIPVFTPGGGDPSLTRTPEIQGTVYAFFGTQDPLIPLEQIDAVEAALQAAGDRHRVFRYAAGHGFCCDQRADYNAAACQVAWGKALELFRQALNN